MMGRKLFRTRRCEEKRRDPFACAFGGSLVQQALGRQLYNGEG